MHSDTTMALINRAGSILRQTVSKHINNDMSMASPYICQMTRCMSWKVFVGGLARATNDTSLREAFSPYGEVSEGLEVLALLLLRTMTLAMMQSMIWISGSCMVER
ncbi:glycine-rich RNA-binding protein 3, mitochondrial-like isoform X3 [Helianthus annuus]|uniref:glycine-rich RNA-binding protein 3, mitochondrial-like isoform X3 n=2 Tax=Helianthus annuus TaxID=4232 RepID=UPI00165334C2|nr:glycine-rich RNA-binding protein 3, mitochondrial-like isoform X3 [Helianthus annuus]XP_035833586.1 glycine-rich RNA-binding protein 3, mitochondrial-like isoform X3 [Helianthus annuus]